MNEEVYFRRWDLFEAHVLVLLNCQCGIDRQWNTKHVLLVKLTLYKVLK